MSSTAPTREGSAEVIGALYAAKAYENQTAAAKARLISSAIQESAYASAPAWTGREALSLLPRALDVFKRFSQRAHVSVTMDRHKDVMPEGRTKPIHTYGSVAPVRFVPEGAHDYTGVFKTGAAHGFVRLSLASKPSGKNTVPGMAVKLLVDGRPSVNYQAMYRIDGQDSHNFFKNDFSNHVPEPKGRLLSLLQKLFEVARTSPFGPDIDAMKVGVGHLAQLNQWGHTVEAPHAPEQLIHRPSEALAQRFSDEPHEVRDDFADIDPGTTLYDVHGVDDRGETVKIGRLETTGPFVASEFGDKSLFFNHQRVLRAG